MTMRDIAAPAYPERPCGGEETRTRPGAAAAGARRAAGEEAAS
ncbi:hypothetical protein [Longimicrobium sp.]